MKREWILPDSRTLAIDVQYSMSVYWVLRLRGCRQRPGWLVRVVLPSFPLLFNPKDGAYLVPDGPACSC